MTIPVIDIFAGPGGLGEGFSALFDKNRNRIFKIVLSIEKEFYAHQTLTLRSFFRQFKIDQIPDDYYDFLKGKIKLSDLYQKWPQQAAAAFEEAWQAGLFDGKEGISNDEVDEKIKTSLKNSSHWLLLGGPPCQAYSMVGRSRRQETLLDATKDKRVELYKQYLRILAIHSPSIFIMENVKGLLSAATIESPIFSKILNDLSDPVKAYIGEFGLNGKDLTCPGYKIYSLVVRPEKLDNKGNPIYDHKDFIIYAEDYGVPQTRHRVILLGIRKDIQSIPETLTPCEEVPISKVLSGLPELRSKLSKVTDSNENWKACIKSILTPVLMSEVDEEVLAEIKLQLKFVGSPKHTSGSEYLTCAVGVDYRPDWFLDKKIKGVCNHSTRGHMESDLLRYFYVSCFAMINNESPRLDDFPSELLPNHGNINEALDAKKFADRFRTQLWDKPSKTITSHISQDGHYYIHPDPAQCRSFTVREAARIQTFPDNYFFCGPRTSQFVQVGNAVPPLLANEIAKIVRKLFTSTSFDFKKKNKKIFNDQRNRV